MISKVLFGQDPETFLQSIKKYFGIVPEKAFQDHVQSHF